MLRVEFSLELKRVQTDQTPCHKTDLQREGSLFKYSEVNKGLKPACGTSAPQYNSNWGCHSTLPVEDSCTQLLKYSLNKQNVKSLFEKTRNHNNLFLEKKPRSYMLPFFPTII